MRRGNTGETRYVLLYAGSRGGIRLQGLRVPPGSCKLLKCLMLGLWHGRVYSNLEFLQVTSAFIGTRSTADAPDVLNEWPTMIATVMASQTLHQAVSSKQRWTT